MVAAQFIPIMAAFLICGGWLLGIVTSPNRQQQAAGEVYAWAVFLAAVFVVLAVAGVRYLAPEIQRLLMP